MTPSILYPRCDTYYTSQPHNGLQTISLSGYSNRPHYLPPQYSYYDNFRFHQDHCYQPLPTMAAPTSNPNEMEDFQRLSDDFHAELPGPLIGDKLPMSVLVTEYAQADTTFVVKTAALAQTYSGYRTVKGDGQCGWRGAVFGYFETLLQLGDIDIVQQERVRLQSFEDTMRMAGIDYDIIIDMFDYTWELFDDLQKAVERQDKNEAVLLDSINDTVKSDSIVYHFKMMTSAFMQLHADQYEPFLEMPIADYRVSRIDPANQEIDQIGLQALTDAVIAPANFAIEVLYLDRSVGQEVTPHSFVVNPIGKPTIRLLYRPGHYDMVYKDEQQIQVFLQKDSIIHQGVEMANASSITGDLQAYLFPGPQASQSYSHSGPYYSPDQGSNTQSRNQYVFSPYPQPMCLLPSAPLETTPVHQSLSLGNLDLSQNYPVQYPSPCSTNVSLSPHPSTPVLTSHPLPTLPPLKIVNEPQIRLNANCFNYRLRHESVPLSTQNYGSAAALSPAHFRNQDFQPQMWRAEEEYLKS